MGGGGGGGGGGVIVARTFHSLSGDVHGARTAMNAAVGSVPPPVPGDDPRHDSGDDARDILIVSSLPPFITFHTVSLPPSHSDCEHSCCGGGEVASHGTAETQPCSVLPGTMVPPAPLSSGSANSSLTALELCGSTHAYRSRTVLPPIESAVCKNESAMR